MFWGFDGQMADGVVNDLGVIDDLFVEIPFCGILSVEVVERKKSEKKR